MPLQSRRALVLGGGGHLGSALVRALLQRGYRVTASTLSAGRRSNLADLTVNRVVGDDRMPGTLEDWAQGHELIIDAAAPYSLDLIDPAQTSSERLAMATDRMSRLLDAAADAGATVVHIGSILAAGPARKSSVRRRVIEAAHPYFRLKHHMQKLAIEAAQRGQPVVIVNPSSLLGPWNLRPFHHCYVSAVLTGGMPASFPETINVLDVRDAAECILRVSQAGWYGQPIPVAGHDISVHTLTDRIVDIGKVRRPPRWQGLSAGAAVLYTAETALGIVGVRSPYPSLPVLLTLASGPVAISGVQKSLGPDLRSLDETLIDEIDWHKSRGCRTTQERDA